MALLFGLVLDCLGQHGRIVVANDLRSARFKRVEDASDRVARIDRHRLALQLRQRRLEIGAVIDAHRVAEVLREFGRDLLGRNEKIGGAVRMGDDIGQGDRRVVDVLAAHVEHPRHGIERGDHGGVIAFLLQPVRNLGALVRARPAGEAVFMRHGGSLAGLGPVGPDRVDRIAVDRDEFDPLLGEQLFRFFSPADAVQPGIVSDPRAFRRIGSDPFRRRGRGHVLVIVELAVDLLAHLHGIAAVGEHGRLVLQHHRAARAAAEAGQPVEPLGIRADIFAHMLVRNGDDEAMEAALFEFGPERIEARFVGLHQHANKSFRRLPSRIGGDGACGIASCRIVTPAT